VQIVGIGEGSLLAREELVMKVKFSDGVERQLIAYIVQDPPFDIIIGLDFQYEEKISFCPMGDGHFELRNMALRGFPVIYQSVSMTTTNFSAFFLKLAFSTENIEMSCHAKLASSPLTRRVSQ